MKLKKHILVAFVMLFLFGCYDESNNVKTRQQEVTVENGRLTFQTMDQYIKTFEEISSKKINVVNDRLLDLEYTSFFEKQNVLIQSNKVVIEKDFDFSVLDIYGLRIIMNENNEFQIGEKIYRIEKDFSRVYSKDGKLLDSFENTVEYLNKATMQFEKKNSAVARAVGESAQYFIPWSGGFYIYDYYTRATTGFLTKYYHYSYNAQLTPPIPLAPVDANYFQWNSISCSCQTPAATPPTFYNTRSVSFYMGNSQRNWANSNGFWPQISATLSLPGLIFYGPGGGYIYSFDYTSNLN